MGLDDIPYLGPDDLNAFHVVIGHFNDLTEEEHSLLVQYLVLREITKCLNEI